MLHKSKIRTGIVGAIAATALAFGFAAPAANAADNQPFGNVKVTGASTVTATSGTSVKKTNYSVTFDGTASLNRKFEMRTVYDYPEISIVAKNKGVSNVSKPSIAYPYNEISPSGTATVTLSTYRTTTPGKYKLTVPVTQFDNFVAVDSAQATKYITVKANTKTSKSWTYMAGRARPHKKFPLTVKAPDYQYGAKVTVYYKASGKSKYKKIATGKLNKKDGIFSRTKINIKSKYNLGGKNGKIYVKIGNVTYAPGYKSAVAKITRY